MVRILVRKIQNRKNIAIRKKVRLKHPANRKEMMGFILDVSLNHRVICFFRLIVKLVLF